MFYRVVVQKYLEKVSKNEFSSYKKKIRERHKQYVSDMYDFCNFVLKKIPFHELARLNHVNWINDDGWYGYNKRDLKKLSEAYQIVYWFTIIRIHSLDSETADNKLVFTEMDKYNWKRAKRLVKFFEML